MAHTTFSAAPNSSTAPLFRAWGSGLSGALATVGMVKASDLGQIDWATVPAPTSTNIVAGFEIWRFNDTLQATHPIYVKLTYGSSTAQNLARPMVGLSVGKGTDGAGNLIGVLFAEVQLGSALANSNYGYSTNLNTGLVATCSGKSCLTVVTNTGEGVAGSIAFIIERSRTNDGTPTGEGLTVAYAMESLTNTDGTVQSAAPNTFVAIAYASGAANVGPIPVVVPYTIAGAVVGAGASLATGVIAPILPWLAFAPGLAPWQPLAAVSYVPGDAVAGTVVAGRILGRDRPYRVVRYGVGANGWGVHMRPFTSSANSTSILGRAVALMILWED